MEEQFDLLFKQLVSSDFITKMNFDCMSKSGVPEDIYMILNPNGIDIHRYMPGSPYVWLDYSSMEDMFYAIGKDRDLDDETIYRLLNFQVPYDSLSDFHRQIIDNNPSTYKPIEICSLDNDINRRRFKLLIEEDEEKIVLTKTKIRER